MMRPPVGTIVHITKLHEYSSGNANNEEIDLPPLGAWARVTEHHNSSDHFIVDYMFGDFGVNAVQVDFDEFTEVAEDDVPGEVWATIAARALLGDDAC